MKLTNLLSTLILAAAVVGCAKPKQETRDLGPVYTEQQMNDDFGSIGQSRDSLAAVGLKLDVRQLPIRFDEKFNAGFRKKHPRIKIDKLRNDQILALQAHSTLLAAHVSKYDRNFQLLHANGSTDPKAGFIPGLKDLFLEEKALVDAKLVELGAKPQI